MSVGMCGGVTVILLAFSRDEEEAAARMAVKLNTIDHHRWYRLGIAACSGKRRRWLMVAAGFLTGFTHFAIRSSSVWYQ
jgi:hypothetical protein